ncbi:MAG: hypothetical protein ACYDC6_09420 [Acidobacteriaceae bacterium]
MPTVNPSSAVEYARGPAPQTGSSSPWRTSWTVFWVAFAVRVLYMTLAHTYRLRLAEDHFQFGWEMGRIARALVTGYGYADPFSGHTGPTTWVAPLYPLLLAGVFKIFGVYTLRSAWVILTINSFFSALTTLTTYEIAARCYGRRVAVWSAWIWALYPAAMQYSVRWVWEMTLSAWLLSCVLVLALRMRGIGEVSERAIPGPVASLEPVASGANDAAASPARDARTLPSWLLFGFLWGLLALSNPSLLLFLPAVGLWLLLDPPRGRQALRTQIAFASASALLFLMCISPWVIRNAVVFHRFIPMRANFGAEFYMGNGPGARGFLMEYDHPFQSATQLKLYRSMGEVAYAQMRGRLAWQFVASDPALFLRNTIKRVYFFWVSVPHPADDAWYVEVGRVANFSFVSVAGLLGLALALKRHKPAAGLFAWAFVLIPLIYYFVTVHARFRNPLEPMIAILGVYLFQSAEKRSGNG